MFVDVDYFQLLIMTILSKNFKKAEGQKSPYLKCINME